jgi:hypothetical protein
MTSDQADNASPPRATHAAELPLHPTRTSANRLDHMTDAQRVLRSLVGRELRTVTGRPNRVLRLEGNQAVVATGRSPAGKPVPVEWVQDALDRLEANGEVEISVDSVGHRSAFVGAVLRELPDSQVVAGSSPPRIRWRR